MVIQEWRLGLSFNPVLNIRKASPGEGRDRRLSVEKERRLLTAVNNHSNPMLGWIVRIALETGMRPSQITALRIHQVDRNKRVARLSATKVEDLCASASLEESDKAEIARRAKGAELHCEKLREGRFTSCRNRVQR